MIHIADFEKDFKGRTFRDRYCRTQSDLTCIGYGDNGDNGNPYFVGMYANPPNGTVSLKTVLMKNVDFVAPKAT